MPIGYSTKLMEEYENIKAILRILKYNEHQWIICVDLKMDNFLLGLHSGYTKHPWFLCYWDSRNKVNHWTVYEWPNRTQLTVGDRNIINPPLVDREKIIFPLLHIKLGLMKQFVKALDKSERCFDYICSAFPGLSIEEKKSGVLDGPQIRQLLRDTSFVSSMNPIEARGSMAFTSVVKDFLGNKKVENNEKLVAE